MDGCLSNSNPVFGRWRLDAHEEAPPGQSARLILIGRESAWMKLRPYPRVWMDDRLVGLQEALVPVTTHSLHYGTSAFEGIRAYWNGENLCIFRLDDHVRRLRRSGSFYNLETTSTDEQMAEAIAETCRGNDVRESAYIRPLYFVGEWGISLHVTGDAPTRFAVIVFPLDKYFSDGGISACVVSCRRFSDQSTPVHAKMSGNYLNSIVATMEAKRNGFEEAIMLDHAGNVSEAAGANIFLVQDGQLVTPDDASSALDGITRDTVIWLAEQQGISVTRRRVSPSELHTSEEVFLTGTASEVVPLTRIGERSIGSGPGRVTSLLMRLYADAVLGRGQAPPEWITTVY